MDLVTALTAAPPASRPEAGGGSDAATGDGAFAGLLEQTTVAPAVAPEAGATETPVPPALPAAPQVGAQPVGTVSPEEILALAGAKPEGEAPPPGSKPAGGGHRAHRVDLAPGLQELADAGTDGGLGTGTGLGTPAVPDPASGSAAAAEGVEPDVLLDAGPAETPAPDPAALAAIAPPPPAPPHPVPAGPPALGSTPSAPAVTAAPADASDQAAGEAVVTPAPLAPAEVPPSGAAAAPGQPLDPETPTGLTPAQLQAAAIAAAATLATDPASEPVVDPADAAIAAAVPAPPRNDGARGRTEPARGAAAPAQAGDAAATSDLAAGPRTAPVTPATPAGDAGADNPFANGTELMSAEAVDPLTLPGAQAQVSAQSRAAAEVAALQTRPSLAHLTAADQVAVHVSRALDAGADSISIRLDPGDLGRVDVTLDFGADGRVVATVLAEKPETLSLLQRDSQSLERALAEAGLKADSGSLNFGLRKDGGAFGQEAGGREGGGTGFGRNGGGSLDDAAPIIPPRTLASMRALDIRV